MSYNNAIQTYQQNKSNTASPGELTLMLYNGCLKFIKLAKIAIDNKNTQEKHTNIIKAQDIIRELMVTLNMEIAMSKNLMQMYDYLLSRLVEANLNNDTALLIEVEGFVTQFRDTWKETIQIHRKQVHSTSNSHRL